MGIVGKKYISDTFDFEKNIVKKTGSGATRGIYSAQPWGGDWFQTSPTTQTGAIKIAIGGTGIGLDDMVQFTVDIYDYASREMVTVRVGGYIYQAIGVGNNTWTNESAIVIANKATQNYTVRFGDDGTNHCVWIGEVNSTWTHPQVLVRNFSAGYEVPDSDVYTSEWSVSFVTAFTTLEATLTNNFPLSSGGTSGAFLPLAGGTMANTNLVTNMNADLLDGQQGSYYVNTSTAQSVAGVKSFSGKIGADGGIDGLTLANGGITGSNYDITGVNQLVISDPGEGIVFTGTATMYFKCRR